MRAARWDGWKRELTLRIEGEGAPGACAFPCEQTVWLGRDPSCEVVLPAQAVSRLHASLFVARGALWVRDHSSYGTCVNGQPLKLAVRRVPWPARLELGPYRLEVALSAPALVLWLRGLVARALALALRLKGWIGHGRGHGRAG